MNVKIKLLRPEAQLPQYMSTWAAGADVFSAEAVQISYGQRVVIPLGFAIELPPGYEAQIRGRSGLFKDDGIIVHTGTVDADYRGECGALVMFLGGDGGVMARFLTYEIPAGTRVAQMIIAPVAHATFDTVDELSPTRRGAGGFGSTGTR